MIRINDCKSKTTLKAAVLVSAFLLFAVATGFGQQVVNLTAGPATTTMPDGTTLPMWGYTCGLGAASVPSTTATTYTATTVTIAGGTLVVNAYVGDALTVVSGTTTYTGVVASNTATTLTLAAPGWTTGNPPVAATPPAATPLSIATASCAPLSGSSVGASTGALGGIYLLSGGSGYTSAPTVTITPATGNTPTTPAAATAIIDPLSGAVVGFNVTSHGAGYTAAPTVALSGGGGGGAVAASGLAWSPVVITVPYGTTGGLKINLTNNLSFTPSLTPTGATSTTTVNNIPTSIVIVGQMGGGLGAAPTRTLSPSHADAQGCPSWFIAAQPPGTPCTAPIAGASGTPPTQLERVQSMGTEVAAVAPGTVSSTSLTWANLKPGTYLLESGTHPSIQVPMGLIGMLVVTTAPTSGTAAGTAYPAVAATTKTAAIPAVSYNAEVPLEFSEIDPVQNKAVDLAVRTSGFSETMVWSGLPTSPQGTPGCGNPASNTYHQCYPPAVNYTPFYFLINGLAFDKANPAPSLFAATAGSATTGISATGTVLVRLANAGLRMHVPAIVGSQTTGFTGAGVLTTTANPVTGFTLIAEDGNPVPGIPGAGVTGAPRVKTEVFMAAGKTYDVMVNVPATPTGATAPPSLPVYDRELSLSANSSVRDAGMVAYIGVNGATLPVAAGTAGSVFATATANPDFYNSVIACATTAPTCTPLVVSDPSKGVIANDINVYGVQLATPPSNGTVTCNAVPGNTVDGICANGTFTYTPVQGGSLPDTFQYCANGTVLGATAPAAVCATVTLNASALAGSPVANNITFTSNMATFIKIPSPGVLSVDSDPNNLPLNVLLTPVPTLSGGTLNMDPDGGFTASVSGAGTLTCPTTAPTGSNCYSFKYRAVNSQGRASSAVGATVTLVFPPPSNLQVKVLDAQAYNSCNGNSACISALTQFPDYRWIIEEDKTFFVDPNCTTNSSISTPGCPTIVGPAGQSTIPVFGVQFHTSNMDFVAQGCTGPLSCEGGQMFLNPATGTHVNAVCDVGNGVCRPDTTGNGFTAVNPSQVHLDPAKRYYLSVLPGDAASPFPAYVGQPVCPANGAEVAAGTGATCGHTMSGAPIPPACNILSGTTGPNACTTTSTFAPVNVLVLPTPLPTGDLSVIVFEDDDPLNGEQDGGGGNGTVAPIEPGLGGFNLVLWDTYGGLGDVTGQDTYDAFNQPLSNSLAGTIDPNNGLDACPISATPLQGPAGAGPAPTGGITGMIVTCPKYESDQHTLSPLAGQAVIQHLMPDKFSVQAYPGADRIARGEQWLQTNTLDGQHPHDSFIRIGEPSYFQEYGPAGYHVAIGFANPAIINARAKDVCAGAGSPGAVGPCTNTIDGQVNMQRLSRIPDERLYPSGSHDALAWTQCWVSLGDPDGEDFQFTFCDANGNFKFSNVPGGNWRLTIGDQWNDQIIDGLSTPANVGCVPVAPATTCTGGLPALHLGNLGIQQWQANVYTRTYIDANKDGIWEPNEIGIPFIYTMIHYRDGHTANNLTTDFNGIANFNETFPLFNWYTVEADSGRYKTTGIHTVYDAGGPADGSTYCGTAARPCGTSAAYKFLANTYEAVPLPADLSVPGAVYCKSADCTAEAASFAAGTAIPSSSTASTGRIDPPWVETEGWAGLTGQSNYIDIGKAPYAACPPACVAVPSAVSNAASGGTTATTTQVGENGGIHGLVVYAATRPFDDASQMIQQPWAPNIPRVTVNLYQEGFAADGVTPTLKLVDTTQSSSWDDWAQGFYPSSTVTGGGLKPYMSCPGQGTNVAGSPNQDLFYFTLFDQPNYLDWYTSIHSGGATPLHPLPYNSQFKCFDSMKINNQVQPAPYDGRYSFPSVLGINPTTGKLVATVGSTNGVTAAMAGTNCTICVANPDSTDKFRFGTPMLPPGKYVVQVMMPPGYEVYKEEDKNLLIGDNFIAPVTQQFGGLGTDIFIIPDQASVASMYDESGAGFNPTNYQDSTTGLGLSEELTGVPGFPGFQDPLWPCVGEMRVVPDYLSLYPQAHETAPFAGATRPLCDRKEVTLASQMSVSAKFYIFTSTHIAGKYTGVITDDMTSEFDPFSPQFGEKFAPPNMPISTKDYLGNELSRVYTDHWGVYDGLTFSSWEVNPPNITGYSPTMQTQCMNDPGPILDTRATIVNSAGATVTNPTYGQLITDPLYNPAYSDFCYEQPYMPGLTVYGDTPVVPTQAFVGAAYNNADCSYPDATPAIKEVDGDGIGPYVSAAGHTLTITALGDLQVQNSAYSGPSANIAPFNLKTITRHYGFGTGATAALVGADGISHAMTCTGSDLTMSCSVPTGVPNCPVQQQTQYGGSTAQCGELRITTASGQQSIDTVTVTIGGKGPTHVAANQSLQGAIDAAAPGDLIIVDPTCTSGTGTAQTTVGCTTAIAAANRSTAAHNEMLLMWKPVRLQGVGAATSIVDANAFPSGKLLDPWRRHVNCLFGLSLSGVPTTTTSGPGSYDSTGAYSCPDKSIPGDVWNYYNGGPNTPQIDRLPLEATVGWDATQNGNLAEQLQEPALMGAYEGAGITVLGKGVDFHGANPWSDGNEGGAFPTATTILTGVGPNPTALPVGDANPLCHTSSTATANPFPSNFTCNPSSIDGLTIRNSSQGGGGIFAHGWAHHLQIANDRIYNNAGTLTGGISVGQGEFATPYVMGSTTNAAPGSCSDGTGWVANQHLPYCLQLEVNVHNNYISNNTSLGDELFSGTLSGGGGVTFCTGNDYYLFNYNWVCGNGSSGEGGALVHLGEIQFGDIEHNSLVLNQSDNPTIPTNGGGIQVMGTPDTDPICGTQLDSDCPPGLSDGTGHGLTINANLIQGNMAESGSGGGIRLQQVNGTEVSTFPAQPSLWNSVSITNNIIVNNLAGWDGAGISLQDAINVSIVNNTIASNDSLASSGVLTQSIGTPDTSAPAGSCVNVTGTTSCPQSAGVTSTQHSSIFTTSLTGLTITCPTGQPNCQGFSNPLLQNNIIWQNRSFEIGVGSLGAGNLNQQNLVSLFTASGAAAPVQTAAGQCATGVSYWDIGVRGDQWATGGPNHASGFTLNPTNTILTSTTGYSGSNSTPPGFVSQYCNGSRVPPTCTVADGCGGPSGFGVPPGIVDASSPNPVFTLTPSATVDEGNNWINVSWGPLALSDDSVTGGASGNYGGGLSFANYAPSASFDGTAAAIPVSVPHPSLDFFGNPRPETGDTSFFDPGAIEFNGTGTTAAVLSVTGGPLAFGTVTDGTTSAAMTLTLHNTGTASGTGIALTFSNADFSRPAGAAGGTCTATLAAAATCTINVVFAPGTTVGAVTGTLTITANVTVTGSPVSLSGTGAASTGTAVLSVTGGPLTFNTASGTTSASQQLTLHNTGTAAASGITLAFTTGFSRPGGGAGGTCGATLAAATTCTINVVFTAPATAGTTNGSLTITASVAVSGSPVTLTGNSVAAVRNITVTPNPAAFGSVQVGSTQTLTLTITASASNNATAARPTVAAPFARTGGSCGGAIAIGATCTYIVGFTPTSATASTGTMTDTGVTINGGTGETLTGTGVASRLALTGPSPALNPATANTGTESGTVTVTYSATATGTFTFTAAPAIGGGGRFTSGGGTCTATTVLNPGGSCTVIVTYAAAGSTTTRTGSVTVTGTPTGLATESTSISFPAN
jgi:hypothetical protein